MSACKHLFLARLQIQTRLRAGLELKGYKEVVTPVLGTQTAADPQIEHFSTQYIPMMEQEIKSCRLFLHTSPELAMKRLLSKGLENIYQICPVFRQGEHGPMHRPEFTMAEWYRTGASYMELMQEVESVVARVTSGKAVVKGIQRELTPPFARLTVVEAMSRAGVSMDQWQDLTEADWRQQYDEAFISRLAPWLEQQGALFLVDFPPQLAQMAKLKPPERSVAERFELYTFGMEIANGASELTDPVAIRARLQKDIDIRVRQGKETPPLPEAFLQDIENKGLPECAGVALGVDRLAMIAAGAESIEQVTALPFAR